MKRKKSCPVCGQGRCVKSTACVQNATQGYVQNADGTQTIYLDVSTKR